MNDFSLAELAELLQAKLIGDASQRITGVASLAGANETELTFYKKSRHVSSLEETKAGAVILREEDLPKHPHSNYLLVSNPHEAFVQAANQFITPAKASSGVHPTVVVGEACEIDPSASLGPYVVVGCRVKIAAHVEIGAGCVIGDDCMLDEAVKLYPRVTLYSRVKIGKRSVIHSGVVIGSDGFGNLQTSAGWEKIPQLGGVIIGCNVEIGANTTIDCGALDNTVIEDGVRLDNLIQVGHNVRIGQNTAIAAGVGIAGSANIGKNCMIGGLAGVNGHIKIADNVLITGMTMVTKSIQHAGVYSSGTGLMSNAAWKKNAARFRQLDKVIRQMNKHREREI